MATRNRYAEIMSQYRQSQPYSFFGYPQSYTGGYDVSQPQAYAAPVNRYADIIAQGAAPMGGGGGRGTPEAPSAFSQMTPAERAAYYSQNPTEGKIALGMQDLFGNVSLMGQAAKYFGNDGWYDSRLEKMGVNPTISLDTQNQLAGEAMQRALYPTGGFVSAAQQQQAAAGREYGTGAVPPGVSQNQFAANYAAYNNPNAVAVPSQDLGFVEGRTSPSSLVYGPNAALTASIAAQAQAQADASAAQASREASAQASLAPGAGSGGGGGNRDGGIGGSNPGDPGRGGGGAHLAKGGYVSMQHLGGPDPEGPDDGYAALKDGEYVINDKAVKKYGIELMNAINSGKISKGKLIGLLEM